MAHMHIREHPAVARRLDEIGWGLLLLLTGVIWLLPERGVPHGTWLFGVGLILLGVNAFRYLAKIPVSGFSIVLGVLAIAGGLSSMYGVTLPLFSMFLIVAGTALIVRPLIAANRAQ